MNFSDSEKDKDIIMTEKEDSADEKDMACDDKKMAGESEDEKLKEEKKEEDNIKDEEKKMAEESEDEKLKEEKKEEDDIADEEKKMSNDEKKFSLDAYVDEAAMLAMLENETEEYKALVEKITKEFSANEILSKFIEMAKENDSLKAEKEKIDTEKRDKKFASIMASVKDDLDEKTYLELSEEGKSLTLNQLGAFENKVKAFAYEATKKNKIEKTEDDDEIMKFGSVDNNTETETDVFVRLSRK